MSTDNTSSNSYGGGGPLAVGVASALLGLATVLLVLRTYTNVKLVKRTTWDILWILAAYLLGLVAQIFLVLCTHYGIANHLKDTNPEHLPMAFLFEWIFNVCTILSTGFGKLAIIAVLLHIQGQTNKTKRYILYFVGVSTMILNVNQSILVWFQCKPIEKLWNVELPGTCNAQHVILSIGVFQGSWSAACDLFLAFWPILIFWQLQLSWKRKLGLSILFAGGAVAGAAAAIKTAYILTLQASTDITFAILPLIVWAEVEMWLIIIMSTIPTLRPLFVKFFRSVTERSRSKSRIRTGGDAYGTGVSASKEYHNGSVQLQSVSGGSSRPGNNRPSAKALDGSESVEDILPKDGGIVVRNDFDVAYEDERKWP